VCFTWTEDAARFVDTLAAGHASIGQARRRVRELENRQIAAGALANYPGLHKLDPHQVVAVAAMTDPAILGLCLFDEQGAGKTVMAIHAFDRLRQLGGKDTLLVFAPKNMVEEWARDFRRFMGEKYSISVVTGPRSAKYLGLLKPADVYVMNYETAHLMELSIQSLLRRNLGRTIMTVDESFFIKNRHTKRAAAVRRLRHYCDRCWVLCGTPAPNHPMDVVHQFDVADGGVTFGDVALPRAPGNLRQTIQHAVEKRGVYLRRLKHHVMPDLPPKHFQRVTVPMEEEQRRLYTLTLRQLVNDVGNTTEAEFKVKLQSFLARRMALFELCSHPSQLISAYAAVPAKVTALDNLLEELIERRGEKVVIWSFFRYSLNEIVRRYRQYNPVRLDGTVTDTKLRADAISRFQEDNKTMLFVGNPAAAGAGITLTSSRTAIYESFSMQAAHYLQSLDRVHRRGQSRDVNYYMLLCQDSIEEDEYERLLAKEQAARELFSDSDPRPLSRDIFLTELLSAFRKL
jgi:SNF2 family DNA or RNA helicase